MKILIRIRIKMKSWIQIYIEVKILIRIEVMQIRSPSDKCPMFTPRTFTYTLGTRLIRGYCLSLKESYLLSCVLFFCGFLPVVLVNTRREEIIGKERGRPRECLLLSVTEFLTFF
jgi:hypothetical protein